MTLSSESMNLKDLVQSSHSNESWNVKHLFDIWYFIVCLGFQDMNFRAKVWYFSQKTVQCMTLGTFLHIVTDYNRDILTFWVEQKVQNVNCTWLFRVSFARFSWSLWRSEKNSWKIDTLSKIYANLDFCTQKSEILKIANYFTLPPLPHKSPLSTKINCVFSTITHLFWKF